MASEIKVDTIVNAGGDNDSGIDLSTNDQVKIKIAGSTDLTFKANEIENSSGDLTLDVAGDISLDANGQQIFFKKDGTTFGQVQTEATPANFTFESAVSDGDIIFKGSDGGSGIEAMRIDMSAGGNLGINTTSPVTKLHVNADTNDLLTLERSGKSSGSGFAGFNIETNSQLTIAYDDGADFVIGTASDPSTQSGFSSVLKITSSGIHGDTTSSSANVQVDSAGTLRRSTSSKRYKNTIKDAPHGLTELLKLRSVTFKGNNDDDKVHGGLIAEEVHDAGLTEFVDYNKDNEPDALAYGNMVALCVKAIQELSAKNDALEARIKKLEDE